MSLLAQDLHLAQSQNENFRSTGWKSLQVRLQSSPKQFLVELSDELAKSENSVHIRQLAGIQLKNTIQNSSNDPCLANLWDSMNDETKNLIREQSLSCLASEVGEVRLVASQAVASIASLDLAKGDWEEVLRVLITNSSNLNKTYKLSAIRTIGYICENLSPGHLVKSKSDSILTVLADCLQPEETDKEIKLVALAALRNSLKFFSSNFENDEERSVIVGLLVACCSSSDELIQASAVLILCDVAGLFYQFIESNLLDLGRTTYALISHDYEQVSLSAVEFWNQVADVEAELVQRRRPTKGYIRTAAATLIPLLLKKFHLFFADQDDWNFQKAASTTLESVSMVLGNEILDHLGEYIATNLKSDSLQFQQAAVVVIGSIVEGLTDVVMLVKVTLPDLVNMTQNHSLQKAVLWVFGKLCEFHLGTLIDLSWFFRVLELFVEFLKSSTELAFYASCGINSVLKSAEGCKLLENDYLASLIDHLLQASMRKDSFVATSNIFKTCLSSIFNVIENSSGFRLVVVNNYRESLFDMLQASVSSRNSLAQESICSVFQCFFGKSLPRSIEDSFGEKFIDLVLQLFELQEDVLEEGLIALGSLSQSIRGSFAPYVKRVAPFLLWSLSQPSNSHNKAALITLGDLSRELGSKVDALVKDALPFVLGYLSNSAVLFEIKVRAIEVLGDLACNNFSELSLVLDEVLRLINSAARLSLNFDLIQTLDVPELLSELREAIIGFYIGVVQGSDHCNKKDRVAQNVETIIDFTLEMLNPALNPGKATHYAALGLFGDLFDKFKNHPALNRPGIQVFIQMIRKDNDPDLKEICDYASKDMQIREND